MDFTLPKRDVSTEVKSSRGQDRVDISSRNWLWLLCLLCLVIVFCSLGKAALFEPDEGRNAEKARQILLLGDWVTPYENFLPTLDKPMFFYWLVAISFKLFGLSEWSARLPSALAALGCVILVYRFARNHWGMWEALWSALILVTSLEFFLLSRFVIFDMTLTFFVTLGLFSFYAASEAENPRNRKMHCLVMYAATAFGTLVKGPIAAAVPGMVIFFYLFLTRKWFLLRRLNIFSGVIVYFMIIAPWYAWVEARNPGYLRYFLWEEHVVRYLTPHFGRSKGWYYYILVLAGGFLPWTFFIPLSVKNFWQQKSINANLFLALWIILPFAFFSASNSKLPHYILPIYPPLALLTGQALVKFVRGRPGSRWRIVWIPEIFAILFIGYLIIGAIWPHLLAKEISPAVHQSFSLLLIFGAITGIFFCIYVVGDLKSFWTGQGAAFMSIASTLALFMVMSGQIIAAASTERAAKSMAQAISPWIGKQDRLVFYDVSIEGLPFYLRLNKPIWLVQGLQKREIIGSIYIAEKRPAPAHGYGQVLFTYEDFAAEWKKNELPLRVFLKERNLPRLGKELGTVPKTLMRFDDLVLVSNR